MLIKNANIEMTIIPMMQQRQRSEISLMLLSDL